MNVSLAKTGEGGSPQPCEARWTPSSSSSSTACELAVALRRKIDRSDNFDVMQTNFNYSRSSGAPHPCCSEGGHAQQTCTPPAVMQKEALTRLDAGMLRMRTKMGLGNGGKRATPACSQAYDSVYEIWSQGHATFTAAYVDFEKERRILAKFRDFITPIIAKKEEKAEEMTKQAEEIHVGANKCVGGRVGQDSTVSQPFTSMNCC